MVDVSTNYMSHIENGLAQFSLPILVRIIECLNITPNKIFRGVFVDEGKSLFEDIEILLKQLEKEQLRFLLDYLDIYITYENGKHKK